MCCLRESVRSLKGQQHYTADSPLEERRDDPEIVGVLYYCLRHAQCGAYSSSRHPHIAHLQRMNHVALLRHPHAGPSVSSQPSVHLLFLRLPHQLVLCQPSPLPVITAVSGCTDVGSVTYNCTSGATLAIHGTDFVDDDNAALVFPYTSGHTVCWINPQLYATNITCNLFTDDRTFLHGDKLEAVQIGFPSIPVEGSIYYYSRPLFYGVAFLHVPLPSITSISGCDDSNNTDGQYTASCLPEVATLTLTGIDFSIFDQAVSGMPYDHLVLNIGGRRNTVRWQLFGTTVIEVPLAEMYGRLVVPDHYTGQPLPVSLSTGQLTTNNVFVSFVSPQPPPRVDSMSGCQTSTVSPLSVGGCVPGVSQITLHGHYLYPPISVYVGGKLCTQVATQFTSPTLIVCVVPSIDEYVPGFCYDLYLNDTVYADEPEVGLLPAAVSYVAGPIVSGVVPCIDTLRTNLPYPFAKCQPGQLLTIVGVGFQPADPAAYVSISIWYGGSDAQCSNLTVLDNEHIVCLLPDLGPSSRGLTLASLTLHTHGNTTQGFQLYVYDVVDPMHVTSLSGCGEQTSEVVGGIPTLASCVPGDTIAIHGSHFPLDTILDVYYSLGYGLSLSTYTAETSSLLVATLPAGGAALVFCTPIYFNVMTSTASVISNPLALVFTPPSRSCSDDSSSSSSSGIPSVGSSGVSSSGAGSGSSGSSSASMIAVSSSSSGAGMASSTARNNTSSASSSGGLSHGAVAGIVIGALITALLVTATLVWLCRLHSRKSRAFSPYSDQTDSQSYEVSTGVVELQRTA